MTYEDDLPEYVEDAMLTLREETINSPRYSIAQGTLYENLRKDTRVSGSEAMDVARHLNNGKVNEAEELINNILGEEQ
jgi:hypothetical protein